MASRKSHQGADILPGTLCVKKRPCLTVLVPGLARSVSEGHWTCLVQSSTTFLVLVICPGHCPIAEKRQHDQGHSYEKKNQHLIEGYLAVSEIKSITIMTGSMAACSRVLEQ